jgi:hypothetical protein
MFSGFHFWWPKMTGKMLDERLGKITFWTLFIGFHGTFLVQHWLGAEGMPRRYADYLAADGFTALNTISTISSFVLGARVDPPGREAQVEADHDGQTEGQEEGRRTGRLLRPHAIDDRHGEDEDAQPDEHLALDLHLPASLPPARAFSP